MDIDKEIEVAKERIKKLEKEVELSRLHRRIADLEKEKMNPWITSNMPITTSFPKLNEYWWENPIT